MPSNAPSVDGNGSQGFSISAEPPSSNRSPDSEDVSSPPTVTPDLTSTRPRVRTRGRSNADMASPSTTKEADNILDVRSDKSRHSKQTEEEREALVCGMERQSTQPETSPRGTKRDTDSLHIVIDKMDKDAQASKKRRRQAERSEASASSSEKSLPIQPKPAPKRQKTQPAAASGPSTSDSPRAEDPESSTDASAQKPTSSPGERQ